ncbi:cuticle protein AMP1A-like [Panulirus ornatus]|uniref:cuticle protein AMP1A-like n=1 Tax=Panulirus ornatus TaxID=150431 RepID=UPI003A8AD3B8
MKLVFFACLLAVTVALPKADKDATILNSENVNEGNGHFRYSFDTSNGISVDATGTPGDEGQSNIAGSYSYTLDDGKTVVVSYVADQGGYQPQISVS